MDQARRIVAGLLGAFLGLNALAMLAAPVRWYGAVPGVVLTGPLNAHFLRDIGAIYLVVAGALLASAARPRLLPGATFAAAAWLSLHAVIHLAAAATCGRPPLPELARDFVGVHLPAILSLWIALAFTEDQRP